MQITDVTKESECCCSCKHNIRTRGDDGFVDTRCEIDNHYIGYVACFESVCEEWEGEQDADGNGTGMDRSD